MTVRRGVAPYVALPRCSLLAVQVCPGTRTLQVRMHGSPIRGRQCASVRYSVKGQAWWWSVTGGAVCGRARGSRWDGSGGRLQQQQQHIAASAAIALRLLVRLLVSGGAQCTVQLQSVIHDRSSREPLSSHYLSARIVQGRVTSS